MNVLITGGAGFIGSHLAELHLHRGDTVYAVDNCSTGSKNNIKHLLDHPQFHFVEADVLTWPDLEACLARVTRVYHLAAVLGMFRVLENPVMTATVNIHTTERILNIVKGFDQKPVIVIASSSEVYGNQAGPLYEERTLLLENTSTNHSTYPISKLCNETMALAYFHEFKVPCIVARIFNTIGTRQSTFYGMVVPRFIQQAIRNETITIFGDGTQKRSFCDVRDTVQLLNQIAELDALIGQVINVGHNDFVSIHELAQLIKLRTHSSSEISYTPFEKAYQGGYIDIHERQIDPKKLLAYTHYTYQWHLADTIDFMVNHYHEET